MGEISDDEQWYYDVATRQVHKGKEPHALDRMGPYPDRETAERALEIAAARAASFDDEND